MEKYYLINTQDLDLINFNEVMETSKQSCNKSIDLSKAIVRHQGEAPESLLAISDKLGPYTQQEIEEIIESSEWKRIYPDYKKI
jgi:hypothetical protein